MTYKIVEQTPTITAGGYSASDAVGGLLEFEDVCTAYSNSGEIVRIICRDNAKQSADTILVLFRETFTPTADNAGFALSDADLANVICAVRLDSAAVFSANSLLTVSILYPPVSIPFVLVEGGTSLFGQLYTKDTPTYVATDDLSIELTVRR